MLTGDDGRIENESPGLMKDSDSQYTLWCSGRTCCEGMLVELKLIKRQDLVAMIAQLVRPMQDQVHIRVDMNKDEMDNFVFCVATKKTAMRLAKDMADVVSSFYMFNPFLTTLKQKLDDFYINLATQKVILKAV